MSEETAHSLLSSPAVSACSLSIEDLAQALYREADPGGVWAADDEISRLYYLRLARRQLQERARRDRAY